MYYELLHNVCEYNKLQSAYLQCEPQYSQVIHYGTIALEGDGAGSNYHRSQNKIYSHLITPLMQVVSIEYLRLVLGHMTLRAYEAPLEYYDNSQVLDSDK